MPERVLRAVSDSAYRLLSDYEAFQVILQCRGIRYECAVLKDNGRRIDIEPGGRTSTEMHFDDKGILTSIDSVTL